MSKYIEVEKLKVEIKGLQCEQGFEDGETERGYQVAIKDILRIITSLQQEKSVSTKGKFVFPNFLYARTLNNKTIDVSYAPQSLDAIEYVRNDSLQHEQESVAERFARIVRGNLIGIDKKVQQKFEQLYFEVTGNKMYGGYND